MHKLIAVTLLLPLTLTGAVQAGRLPDGARNTKSPTKIHGTSSQVMIHFSFPTQCDPRAVHHHGAHQGNSNVGNQEIAPCVQ